MPDYIDQAIEVLNRIHAADPTVLPALMALRVPCNQAVADDPTVQVGHIDDDPDKGYDVGLLGIINGLFGIQSDHFGHISAVYVYPNTDKLIRFQRHYASERLPDASG